MKFFLYALLVSVAIGNIFCVVLHRSYDVTKAKNTETWGDWPSENRKISLYKFKMVLPFMGRSEKFEFPYVSTR